MSNKLQGHSGRRIRWAAVFPIVIGLIAFTLALWHFIQPR